ncbi:hypothetical protein EUX98_g1205 [Antrodiella citrinella]|uniref:Protein N-terminal glutamine amidohydrolase n=1 Tax=Antrodiella citrinella TaxID=2447956 RepID=A0A4S4NAL8_9APHY|nr:hypothetical protein EUX98_g1205 [Antrodiella citrinella]
MGSPTQQCIVYPLLPPTLPENSVYTSCYCEENIYLLGQALLADPASFGLSARWEAYAVFISNEHKSVALWRQKAGQDLIIWDYHVVLIVRPAPHEQDTSAGISSQQSEVYQLRSWVYDFDTLLPVPCLAQDYMSKTVPYAFLEDPRLGINKRFVRIVPIQLYLDHFASDRSHMIKPPLVPSGENEGSGETDHVAATLYYAPPPSYAPLCGARAREKGISHNLMNSFVSMKASRTDDPISVDPDMIDPTIYGEVMDCKTFLTWLDVAH